VCTGKKNREGESTRERRKEEGGGVTSREVSRGLLGGSKQEVASGSSWELHAPAPSDSRRRQGNLQKNPWALEVSLECLNRTSFAIFCEPNLFKNL
jgi:hypothetical protein